MISFLIGFVAGEIVGALSMCIIRVAREEE